MASVVTFLSIASNRGCKTSCYIYVTIGQKGLRLNQTISQIHFIWGTLIPQLSSDGFQKKRYTIEIFRTKFLKIFLRPLEISKKLFRPPGVLLFFPLRPPKGKEAQDLTHNHTKTIILTQACDKVYIFLKY